MVDRSEEVIMEEEATAAATTTTMTPSSTSIGSSGNALAANSRSQERFLDADEFESSLLPNIVRPSARLRLENLIAELRREGKALRRVEESSAKMMSMTGADNADGSIGKNGNNTAINDAASPNTMELDEVDDGPSSSKSSSSPAAAAANAVASPPIISTNKYLPFPTYLFDAGRYNSPLVTVYLPLDGIGTHDKSKISCKFTSTSFDLIISDFHGKSYRLLNDNLEKDIDVSQSKYVVKPNKIILKLGKVKGEYGSYDTWTQLTSKKDKASRANKDSSNPAAGIMDLMKDMYDEGDENMKKMIGETMYKQRMGQLNKDDGMGGMGMGGMGDMMDV